MKFFYTLFLSLLMCTNVLAQAHYDIEIANPVQTDNTYGKVYTFDVTDNGGKDGLAKVVISSVNGGPVDLTVGSWTPKANSATTKRETYQVTVGTTNCTVGTLEIAGTADANGFVSINSCTITSTNVAQRAGQPTYSFTYSTMGSAAPDPIEFTATSVSKSVSSVYNTIELANDENSVHLELLPAKGLVNSFTKDDLYGNGEYCEINGKKIKELTTLDIVEITEFNILKIDGKATLSNNQVVTFHGIETLDIAANQMTDCYYYGEDGMSDYIIQFGNDDFDFYIDIENVAENDFEGTYSLTNCYQGEYGGMYTCLMGQDYYDFNALDFKLAGNPKSSWSIIGTANAKVNLGTEQDPDLILVPLTFSYSNVPVVTSEDITISAAGYTTYYNPTRAVELPAGLKAYFVSYNSGSSINFEQAYGALDKIAAGTPVILEGTANQTYTLNYVDAGFTPIINNSLQGADTYMDADQMAAAWPNETFYHYAVSLNEEGDLDSVGLYWVEDDGAAFEIPAGKAYFVVRKDLVDAADPAAARGFAFADATGIHSINTEAQATTTFNAAGQLVKEAKGLVVRQGQMMFVK